MKRCFQGARTMDTAMTASGTDIRCPSCRHKLMVITAGTAVMSETGVMKPGENGRYAVTTRCPRCKTYVGVTIRDMAI